MSEVHHDPDTQRFTIRMGNDVAELRYSRDREPATPAGDASAGEVIVGFDSVFVPPALRGRGVAGELAASAFAYAREAGWRVRPTCSYLSGSWVPRHPDVHDLII